VTLAPPRIVPDDAREMLALLRFGAECVDHRPRHVHAEGDDGWRAGAAELLIERKRLRRTPAEPAVLLRPLAGDPALGSETLEPSVILLAFEMLAESLLAFDLRRQLAFAEGTYLGAEGVQRCI